MRKKEKSPVLPRGAFIYIQKFKCFSYYIRNFPDQYGSLLFDTFQVLKKATRNCMRLSEEMYLISEVISSVETVETARLWALRRTI